MYEKSLIRDIFINGPYTFRYDEQLIVDITFLINEHLLILETKVLCDIQEYYQYCEDLKLDKSMSLDAEGGSLGHMALKYIGRDYLLGLGYDDVNFEQQFAGYVPDVITIDEKIIIECGNTNPDKVFNYFKNPKIEQLIVIPYPSDDINSLKAYIFKPTTSLSEFLLFRELEMSKKASSFRTEIS